jgi:hypothetical protein
MSNQLLESDLLVDLSTEKQELLTGGCYKSSDKGRDDRDDRGEDSQPKYKFISYRPIYYRPFVSIRPE